MVINPFEEIEAALNHINNLNNYLKNVEEDLSKLSKRLDDLRHQYNHILYGPYSSEKISFEEFKKKRSKELLEELRKIQEEYKKHGIRIDNIPIDLRKDYDDYIRGVDKVNEDLKKLQQDKLSYVLRQMGEIVPKIEEKLNKYSNLMNLSDPLNRLGNEDLLNKYSRILKKFEKVNESLQNYYKLVK